MALHGNMLLAPASGYSGYSIDNSMLFDSGSSQYLSVTPSSTGDRKTWTTSFYVKRHKLATLQYLFSCAAVSGNDGIAAIYFGLDDKLRCYFDTSGANPVGAINDRVYRDVGSFYHIIWSVDAANTTHRIWVNGVEETISGSIYPPNYDYGMNYANHAMTIGAQAWGAANYADITVSEFRHQDGQYITDPTTFGEFWSGNDKAWRPIQPSGLTYGTNGFYLPFTQDTPNLGVDYSGNGNDWTENGSPVQSSDSPTVNVCTWNPLNNFYHTLANGNRTVTSGGNYSWRGLGGTVAVPATGKWYYECALTSTGTLSAGIIGWIEDHVAFDTDMSDSFANMAGLYVRNDSASNQTQYLNFSTNTTIENVEISDATYGIAIDFDNAKLWISKNNTWYSGDPSAGTGGYSITVDSGKLYTPFTTPLATGANPWTNVTAFAEDEWAYTAPTGFKAIAASNLPDPTITDPGEYFNVVGYTASNSTQSITGVGFQPDLTWHKNRTDANRHALFDVLRGVTNRLASDNTDAEVADADTLTSFDSDGFSIGADTGQFGVNDNGSQEFVTWCWKSGGAGVPNTDGTTTATVSANDDAGFSIATWASPLSATTIGHGLSAEPELIIAREYDGVMSWRVYHKDVGNGHYLLLDTTGAKSATSDWNSTDPTSSVFSVSSRFNTAGNYLAYCFRSIPGYSKVFSYTGNGSSDGPFVYLGFNPGFLLIKRSDSGPSPAWIMKDIARQPYNKGADDVTLYAENSNAESNNHQLDWLSNGFKFRSGYSSANASGGTYIGIAFAENPFGGSNIPLGLAR